jgi:hypothetical protein
MIELSHEREKELKDGMKMCGDSVNQSGSISIISV